MSHIDDITLPNAPLTRSYLYGAPKTPLVDMTLAEALNKTTEKYPEKIAITYLDPTQETSHSMTFLEWQKSSKNLAASLKKMGITSRHHVAILAPNCKEFLIATWGLFYIGATAVFLSHELKSGEDILGKLKATKCKGLIIFNDDGPMVSSIIETILFDPKCRVPTRFIVTIGQSTHDGIHSLQTLINSAREADLSNLERATGGNLSGNNDAIVCFTAGTTGNPKAVPLNHVSLINAFTFILRRFGIDDQQVFFNDRPLTWLGGFLSPLCAVLFGARVVSVDTSKTVNQHDTEFILGTMNREDVTHAMTLPYLLYDIVHFGEKSEYKLRHLKAIFVSGQMVPSNLVADMIAAYPNITAFNAYGNTETSGPIVTIFAGENLMQDGSVTVGLPIPHCEVKIIDSNDKITPINESGEVCLRGPNWVSRPYRDSEGWFRTGDIGKMSTNGRLFILGRCKDMIKRGTRSILPSYLETVIATHPSVESVCVVGVPDERLYEEICACIVVKAGATLTAEDMTSWCDEVFAAEGTADGMSMAPKYFIFVDSLPVATIGKIDRKNLWDHAVTTLGIQVRQ
ncbi:unnamed protein product [Owenia fusiformis]|uniref:Uncharacterized protein n=1 Tax=Owenia fusiformis TaxID=6347 RepID=A0A8J1U868_OWEFU|nr:unnamed protein product [Owenia fusiformis]